MPDIGYADYTRTSYRRVAGMRARRAWLVAIVAVAGLAGALVTGHQAASAAVAQAGPELTRLLRAMAGMKAMFAAGLLGATLWRLAAPVSGGRFAVYALACAAMAAGPGLIWSMAHLKLGALLLHGGLFIGVVALWRDPAMGVLLEGRRSFLKKRDTRLFLVGPDTPAG